MEMLSGGQVVYGTLSYETLKQTLRGPSAVVRHPTTGEYGLWWDAKDTASTLPAASVAVLPSLEPQNLGDPSFLETHNVRYAYVGGSMARGIASCDLVACLVQRGMFGFLGAAGLPLDTLAAHIDSLQNSLGHRGWGVNLIHTPTEPRREDQTIDLLLQKGVTCIEASAFMALSPAVVRFAVSGLSQDESGCLVRKNRVFAKISRPEIAAHFLSPPPQTVLDQLLQKGLITLQESLLASQIPLAEDVTIESDSGGHTDNRPLGPLFSVISDLRTDLADRLNLPAIQNVRLGAAGGMGTPQALAAAFAMGAAYVVVGTVHQACVEAGTHTSVKQMLAKAGMADCAMTASADMFERGVKVQVLKRGTMMPQRGNQLYALYSKYPSLEELPAVDVQYLEKDIFRKPIQDVWQETQAFFQRTEPHQLEIAAHEPKHKMALVFRWYLGKTSQWPIQGETARQIDYQVWCGPVMGAFNSWAKGSAFEAVEHRRAGDVALSLLQHTCCVVRAGQLRSFGLRLEAACFAARPDAVISK